MAIYYISAAGGSNAFNGLGPDASHASNRPWLTLGKALNTGSPVVPGDTVYIAPGVLYEGASISPIAGVASTASPTAIRGDPLNAQGFKDGSGVRVPIGVCWVTTRTSGDGLDGPVTSTAALLVPVIGCNGLQFYDLAMATAITGSNASIAKLDSGGNADWLFQDCRLAGGQAVIDYNPTGTPTATRNLTVRRCILTSGAGAVFQFVRTVAAATADADLTILFENCLIIGRFANLLGLGASGGNIAGGIRIKGCSSFCPGASWLSTTALRVSTVTPIRVEGNVVLGSPIINAGTAGHVVDDGYNRFLAGSAATNFTPAGTTLSDFLPNMVFPDLVKWGLELPRSDIFGWTDAAHANQKNSAWAPSALTDYRGRTIRPWGAGSGIGAWESPDAAQDTSSAITGGGANSLKFTGAGELDLYVPVDAVSTTLSIATKSTSYGGTNYPQFLIVANPDIGVTAQTVTASDATEQTLTTSAFTPTAKGVIKIRLVSRSSSVSSSTFFDKLAG